MKQIMQYISWISIIVLILPSVLFLFGKMQLNTVKNIMLIATLIWFAVTLPSMWQNDQQPEDDRPQI